MSTSQDLQICSRNLAVAPYVVSAIGPTQPGANKLFVFCNNILQALPLCSKLWRTTTLKASRTKILGQKRNEIILVGGGGWRDTTTVVVVLRQTRIENAHLVFPTDVRILVVCLGLRLG